MSAPATFACGTCGAALVFAAVRTATCPFCASANVLPRSSTSLHTEPAFALAFSADAGGAREVLRRWLGSRTIFADRALRRATVEDLRGIYVPAYLYSAVARTAYTAQIGEHYTDTETYTVEVPDESVPPERPELPRPKDSLPFRRPKLRRPRLPRPAPTKREVRTRQVTKTEYRPLRGRHLAYVNDLIVSASVGLAHHEVARLGPFDLRELRRYSPALVAGFIQEEYSRSAEACERASRAAAGDQMAAHVRRFLPGDSHAELEHHTTMQWESLDPLLVPVWVLAVRYRADRPPLRVLINGQTHAVVGKPPLVWWKVALAIGLAVALGVAIAWAVRSS